MSRLGYTRFLSILTGLGLHSFVGLDFFSKTSPTFTNAATAGPIERS